jgi:hypothetical protein
LLRIISYLVGSPSVALAHHFFAELFTPHLTPRYLNCSPFLFFSVFSFQ